MDNTVTREELEKWQEEQIGKPCPKHPNHILKDGKYGIWCGVKTPFGWCNGDWPTEEWKINFRKEHNEQAK